ncbi:MAG: hypothetical protein ACRDY4_07660 [Acidimicrobiia bacterium]
MDRDYQKPEIVDYGTLVSLTEASGANGAEDGGSKALIHHSAPIAP